MQMMTCNGVQGAGGTGVPGNRRRMSFDEYRAANTEELKRDPKFSVELFKAVEFLSYAKNQLRSGRPRPALRYAIEAKKTAQEAKMLHREVLKRVQDLEGRIFRSKMIGFDTTRSEGVLQEIKALVLDTRYKAALDKLGECEKVLERSLFLPFPLLDTKIKIKTLITFEEGNIIFRVKLENYMDETLGSIVLVPSVPQDVFAELPEQMIGEIEPRQSKEVTFTLAPKVENWSVGIPGALIQGRDVTVRTILSCDYGKAQYKVRIENNTHAHVENILITPFIPAALEPDEPQKVIKSLPPLQGETVVFELRPRGMAPEDAEVRAEVLDEVVEEARDEDDGVVPDEENMEWDQASWEFEEDRKQEAAMEWEPETAKKEAPPPKEELHDEDDLGDLSASDFRPVAEDFSFISYSPDRIHKLKKNR